MAASVANYLKGLEARLAAVEGNLGIAPAAGVAAGAGGDDATEMPEWLEAYDVFMVTEVAAFVAISKDIGDKVADLVCYLTTPKA